MKKVAINGFGRIGRLAFRLLDEDPEMEVVAINDLTDAEQLAYLLKYDTSHRRYKENEISFEGDNIVVGDRKIKVYAEMDPKNLPWKELEIDEVFECTGKFVKYEDAYKHIEAGAKKVIISAPSKSDDVKTIVYGVNDSILDGTELIVSAASCTTNCLAPIAKVLNDNIGIECGYMSTIHAYTNDQVTLDVAHKKGINSRRGRACAANIVPTSTGAASAIEKVIPELNGLLEGLAYRVPLTDGSLVELTFIPKRKTSIDEINHLFEENTSDTIKITYDPIVSSDIIGKSVGALVDGMLTSTSGNLVKVTAWYDNEYGYTSQMLRTAKAMFK